MNSAFGLQSAMEAMQNAWSQHPEQFKEEYQQLIASSMAEWSNGLEKARDADNSNPMGSIAELLNELLQSQNKLMGEWLEKQIDGVELNNKTKKQAKFWTKELLTTFNPNNFFWLNPKAINKAIESNGLSVLQGSAHLLEDLADKTIKMVDTSKFQVGVNLAVTPGAVIFKNELMELIQYKAQTSTVYKMPILITPPWINKYYVLDMAPEKSLANFLVQQGFTVFMISWRNPTKEMRDTGFDDYVFTGVMEAVKAVKEICQVEQIHTVGYCIGGTALVTLLAWLNAKAKSNKQSIPIAGASFLCSLQDFTNPGEIEVFIDEPSVAEIERVMNKQGYLDGLQLQHTFRLLRSDSLVWNYYEQRYLLGEEVAAFDVLYWNSDSTRLPAKMHSFYLRELYLKNNLAKNGAITLRGVPIALSNITQPIYAMGTEQDHITPWQATFKIASLTKSQVRYALAASGHIVGVLTPPSNPPKRYFYANNAKAQDHPEQWLQGQNKQLGSWWEDWSQWLKQQYSEQVPAVKLGSSLLYPILYPAPGKYVLE